jgi:hypothetical protein
MRKDRQGLPELSKSRGRAEGTHGRPHPFLDVVRGDSRKHHCRCSGPYKRASGGEEIGCISVGCSFGCCHPWPSASCPTSLTSSPSSSKSQTDTSTRWHHASFGGGTSQRPPTPLGPLLRPLDLSRAGSRSSGPQTPAATRSFGTSSPARVACKFDSLSVLAAFPVKYRC